MIQIVYVNGNDFPVFGRIEYTGLFLSSHHVDLFRRQRLMMFYVCIVVVVALLFYVHGKHLSCRDGQLT